MPVPHGKWISAFQIEICEVAMLLAEVNRCSLLSRQKHAQPLASDKQLSEI